MRIVVVGAGEVGSSIAASLADSHDVIVIDLDDERVDSLTFSYDVLAIQGDGTSLKTLTDADIARADLFVASTDNDEANIVACSTVKTVSDAFTIARVRKIDLLETWRNATDTVFGVDFMVSTDLLTAEAVVRVVGLPAALDVDPFARGTVQMAELLVPPDSPVANLTVSEADQYEKLTFAALLRNDDIEIAAGDSVIHAADRLVVIGTPESVRAFANELSPGEHDGVGEIVIIGGDSIGYQIARLLESSGTESRLIESDGERARELAERLPKTMVMENDPTDADFLDREHVGDADIVVASLGSDEGNLLVSLLAKRAGVERAIAVVERADYVDLFEAVGIDVAVNPRGVTAEEITRFTREQRTENVALIESDRAEVVEIEIDEESVLAGRQIKDSIGDLPSGVVFGAITRGNEFITPRGDTVIEVGDHVVAFARTEIIDDVTSKI